MKKTYLSIFWKLFLSIILTVALFAFLNIFLVWDKVYDIFDNEISKRGINIARNIANQSVHYVLYNDISTLQTIIDNSLHSDQIILYCFITNKNNKILAHTFEQGFPKKLLYSNILNENDSISIKKIQATNFKANYIKDIMIPILEGKIGYVRIGVSYDSVWGELKVTLVRFIILFLSFTLLGFLGAYFFAYVISNPIKKIKQTTEAIDLDNIANQKLELISGKKSTKHENLFIFKVDDEIDDLVEKFDEMIIRLETTYQKLILTQNAMIQSEKLASIGTLVAGIAHEINNPLSGLNSCIRRISEKPDNIEQNIKYFSIMNDAVAKIQNVVNGLLDFTRTSNVKKSYHKLSQMIESAINLIKYRKVNLDLKIAGDYSKHNIQLYCNKNQIEQVFFNLLKNSYDAIEERQIIDKKFLGNIEINVSLNDKNLNLIFLDNGIGIKKNDLNKVFDPFFTTKDVGKGTGLGCSICYNIIKEHEGEMTIESEPLNWTKVSLIFNNNKYEIENYE